MVSETGEEIEGFSAYWDQEERASILRIRGDLDLSASSALRALLLDEVGLDGPPIVLDLGEVPFIDSTCLGVLIGALREVGESRGALRLAAAQPRVRRAFEIAALDDLFPLYPSVDEALAAEER
ncbi:MAG TPA: STAS domain-containing protein [Acidimicrobiales bacterium]|nr:STAS domain-containing protein [Acidimicrobiales bacterium]